MSPKNLWGSLQTMDSARTPTVVLQEQAGLLGQLTDEILAGRVSRSSVYKKPDRIGASLTVVAPALGHYIVSILSVEYPLAVAYPALVHNNIDENEWQVETEEELNKVLSDILSSENVRKIISSLIAESQLTSQV